jgi:Cu+-exporting ATPase
VLLDQSGAVDCAFVTGEAQPVSLVRGSHVPAGGRAARGTLRVVLTGPASNSRLAALWTDPVFTRPKPHALTDLSARFGRAFTTVAVFLAAAGAVAWWPDAVRAADVATAVLIIACPCALTLAAPIALGTGMGVLGRGGCYLRQPGVLLDLARVTLIDFDKTGTLTAGATTITLAGLGEDAWRAVRRLAAASTHPVSRAVAASGQAEGSLRGLVEHDGAGLRADVDGVAVAIGSAAFIGVDPGVAIAGRTYASVAGRIGTIDVAATVRPGVIDAVRELAVRHQTWLLSGDHARGASQWTVTFNGRTRFDQSPADKLATIRRQQAADHRVLMIGDGLNDAGALAAADVGIAVSDDTACLVPACDALLRGDGVAALPAVLRYARQARMVIVLCFAVSVVYNVGGLWLALAGRLTPLASAILMPASSLTIVALSAGLMRLHGRRVAP